MREIQPAKENASFEISLKIILKNNKGEVLLLKMPEGSSMSGYYDLLGGRIREKEKRVPFRKILTREVREEIGNKIKYKLNAVPVAIGRHYYFSKRQQKIQYIFWTFFEALYQSGKINVSLEHAGYKWVKLSKRNYKKYFVKGPREGMGNYLLKTFVNPA